MISKKQRFLTILLVIILAAAIVGGVCAIGYYKVGITFPWQVTSNDFVTDKAAKEPEQEKQQTTEPKLVIKEAKKQETEVDNDSKTEIVKDTTEKPSKTEEVVEETTSDVASTGQSLDYYGKLFVEDGRLVDSDGKEARLVGVSTHGLSWFPEFVTADTIKSLRDNWGINVIRLAMYTSDYNGYCVGDKENQQALKDKIDEAIKACTDNNMYVIIDWHTLNDGNPNEYKSDAIQFFGELVRKYEDNENIIYEICNEPNGDTTWQDIKDYANEVIPVIRNVNKDALILVGTPEWSSDLNSVIDDQLSFDNIMYTYHFYAGTHKTTARNDLMDALDYGLPVFISEYGFVSADGTGAVNKREALQWIDLINQYGLSSCVWNLSNKDEGSALIAADSEAKTDFKYDDLSEQGQYFFDRLKDGAYTDKKREPDANLTEDEEETTSKSNTKTRN